MATRFKRIKPDDMTDSQRECFDMLCDAFGGAHHVPNRIYAWGIGKNGKGEKR
jgi:hypothetical protein